MYVRSFVASGYFIITSELEDVTPFFGSIKFDIHSGLTPEVLNLDNVFYNSPGKKPSKKQQQKHQYSTEKKVYQHFFLESDSVLKGKRQ